VIAAYLEDQSTSYGVCDENHERGVEIGIQDLLTSVDDTQLEKNKSV
jgi:hypothetical protein